MTNQYQQEQQPKEPQKEQKQQAIAITIRDTCTTSEGVTGERKVKLIVNRSSPASAPMADANLVPPAPTHPTGPVSKLPPPSSSSSFRRSPICPICQSPVVDIDSIDVWPPAHAIDGSSISMIALLETARMRCTIAT
ncbi:hypothetical protein ZHAS_00003681 [Anopheles sinensis]|uniref:Uncharacterized protein n=1 Tax=Anopheles sinensis TaxID=74873 RepID=A0A084VF83_ANOSI|nr:hypothetical protein ZHAS_00003681 [Anopheles sinensis]